MKGRALSAPSPVAAEFVIQQPRHNIAFYRTPRVFHCSQDEANFLAI